MYEAYHLPTEYYNETNVIYFVRGGIISVTDLLSQ